MTDIIFITAFKDLNRETWGPFARPAEEYIKWFTNLSKLPLRLICYCEPPVEKQLHALGFHNTYPYGETYMKFLDKEIEIMNSAYYKDLVKHRNDPETNKPGYNLVNHNKSLFIKRTAELFPNYTHYAWIDFGYFREKQVGQFNFHLEKTSFTAFSRPTDIKSPVENIICPVNYLKGSPFFVKKEDVAWYYEVYYRTVMEYFTNGLVDDDQAINLQIYKNYSYRFNLLISPAWFDGLDRFKVPPTIDLVIPTCVKDIHTLDLVIEKARQNIPVRNIYVICHSSLKDCVKGIFVDEDTFPFSMEDCRKLVLDTRTSRGGPGWFFQQLLKLYSHTIKGISTNVLIVDSETIFYNKYTPIHENTAFYTVSNEVNSDYRSHMKHLLPYLNIYSDKISGICHQMLFQRHVIQNLFDRVTSLYGGLPFWKIFMEITRQYKCVYSEYDLYFNFILHFHPATICIKNEIRWDLTGTIPETSEYTYLTAHSHLRGQDIKKDQYFVNI